MGLLGRSKTPTPAGPPPPAKGTEAWRELVVEAVKTSPTAKELSLATVTPNGPRNRTVTFQGFSPSGLLMIATDPHSHKVEELKHNQHVEIAWFIPSAACQFRIRGVVGIIDTEDAQRRIHHLPAAAPELEHTYWDTKMAAVLDAMPPARRHPMVMLALEAEHVQHLNLMKGAYTEWTEHEDERSHL